MKISFHELCWGSDKKGKPDTLLDMETYTQNYCYFRGVGGGGGGGGGREEVEVKIPITNFPALR